MPRKSRPTSSVIGQIAQLYKALNQAVAGLDPSIVGMFSSITLGDLIGGGSSSRGAKGRKAAAAKPAGGPLKRAARGSKQLGEDAREAVKKFVADSPSLVSMVEVLRHMEQRGMAVAKAGLQTFLKSGPFKSHGKARGTKYSLAASRGRAAGAKKAPRKPRRKARRKK